MCVALPRYTDPGGGRQPPPDYVAVALGRTWRRNSNYRHGRWCRYRRRLERRAEQVEAKITQFARGVPWYAPFGPRSWPKLDALVCRVSRTSVFLPRRSWAALVALCTDFYEKVLPALRAWLRAWQESGAERPPSGWAVLALLFTPPGGT